MRGTWPRPSSAISRSSHPSTFPSIDPSSTPSFTSSRPLPPTRSTRSSPSSPFRPAISSKPQPENPLSGLSSFFVGRVLALVQDREEPGADEGQRDGENRRVVVRERSAALGVEQNGFPHGRADDDQHGSADQAHEAADQG